MSWQWLENPARPARWGMMTRVAVKALILFALVNLAYAALDPLDTLARHVSVYNWLVPGTERITAGYGFVTVDDDTPITASSNIPALIAAHKVTAPKPADEFRVLMLGDSATRAGYLTHQTTVTGVLNASAIQLPDGRRIVAYNIAYPVSSALKDFMILEEAFKQNAQPDAVIWTITPRGVQPERQLTHKLVQSNLKTDYAWLKSAIGEGFAKPQAASLTWENTLIGQSRPLADLLRLQAYSLRWAASRYDGGGNPEYTIQQRPIPIDKLDSSILGQPAAFFTFEIIDEARALLGDVPIIIVNEPMYQINDPDNPLILNHHYSRDVYEHYQRVTQQYADENGWHYFDLWDVIPPEYFTNSPLHYDAEGARILAERLADIITQTLAEESR